jgi:hypothetical protein
VSGSDADVPAADERSSPEEEQAKQGSEESFATAKLRADVARQQMRLAKDQLKRARKRFKEARREARRARKLADVARRAWKRTKRRGKTGDEPQAAQNSRTHGGVANGSGKKPAGPGAGGKRGSIGKKRSSVRRIAKDRKAGSGARRRR